MWAQIIMKILSAVGAGLQGSKAARTQATALSTNPNDAYAPQPNGALGPTVAEGAAPSSGEGLFSQLGAAVGKGVGAASGGSGGSIGPVASGADYGAMLKGAGGGGGWQGALAGIMGKGGMGGGPTAAAKTPAAPVTTTPVAPPAAASSGGWFDKLKEIGGKAVDYAGQAQDTYHDAILGPGASKMSPEDRRAAIWRSRLLGVGTALQGGGPGEVIAARAASGGASTAAARRYMKEDQPEPFAAPKITPRHIGNGKIQDYEFDSRTGQETPRGEPYDQFRPASTRAKSGELTRPQARLNHKQDNDRAWLLEQKPSEIARLLKGELTTVTMDGVRVRSARSPKYGESPEQFDAFEAALAKRARADFANVQGGGSNNVPGMLERGFDAARGAAGQGFDAARGFFGGGQPDPRDAELLDRLRQKGYAP